MRAELLCARLRRTVETIAFTSKGKRVVVASSLEYVSRHTRSRNYRSLSIGHLSRNRTPAAALKIVNDIIKESNATKQWNILAIPNFHSK